MNKFVEILEDILTGNFIDFGSKNTDLSIVLGILSPTFFLGKNSLQIYVLSLQQGKVVFKSLNFLQSCRVEMPLHGRLQADEPSPLILELEHSPADSFLSIEYLIP